MFRPLCKTVSGSVCKFPFSFHNETFSACTDFWHHGSWCATRVDSFGQVQHLGQCGEHCDFVSFVSSTPPPPPSNHSESDASMSPQNSDTTHPTEPLTSSSSSASSSVSSASSQPDDGSSSPISSSSSASTSSAISHKDDENLSPASGSPAPSQPDNETASPSASTGSAHDGISSPVVGTSFSETNIDSTSHGSSGDVISGQSSASIAAPSQPDISSLGREFTVSAPSACLTVSGPDPGRDCQFPFTFQGRTYAGCTYSFGIPQSWCSTATSEAGLYIPGSWGYCAEPCPVHHDANKECLTVSGPVAGELCVFPFVSEEKFHWGCTR